MTVTLFVRVYEEDRITIREASNITGLPLREVLSEFCKKGIYIKYSEDELQEDLK